MYVLSGSISAAISAANALFIAKPTDHKYMMDWVDAYGDLDRVEFEDDAGRRHIYEWINYAPLNGQSDTTYVNFLRCFVLKADKAGEEKVVYQNSWVADISVTAELGS